MLHGLSFLKIWQGVAIGFGLGLMLVSSGPASAQDLPAAVPHVVDMRILNNAERARLVIDLSAVSEFAIASLAEPDRVVVDVKADDLTAPIEEKPAGTGLIGAYSLHLAEQGRIRAVLTLSAPAQIQQAYMVEALDSQPARLIVDLIPDTPERFAARVEDDYRAAKARQQAGAAAGDSIADEPDTPEPTVPATDMPLPVIEGRITPRPLVVIDPGHGGVDGGAEAENGVTEKNIVLKFARELQRLLVEQDRFDVAMTREDDTFLRLEERVAVARANKADLFISIHADAFQDVDIRGTSIYVRDEQATDMLDKVLADSENRSDLVAGFTPPDTDKRVTSILLELMRRETRRQSYLAANAMLSELEPDQLRHFPLHKANFFVLQAPEVPSVLIELGFMSNPADVANLTKTGWRDKTAEAIARGIAAYFDQMAQN